MTTRVIKKIEIEAIQHPDLKGQTPYFYFDPSNSYIKTYHILSDIETLNIDGDPRLTTAFVLSPRDMFMILECKNIKFEHVEHGFASGWFIKIMKMDGDMGIAWMIFSNKAKFIEHFIPATTEQEASMARERIDEFFSEKAAESFATGNKLLWSTTGTLST